MTYVGDEGLEELLHFADHFLLESGVKRGSRPNIYSSPHTLGETSVDYVPKTNTVVFRGAEEGNLLEIEEDTVKLLANIYTGVHDDFTWSSDAFNKLERSLEELPDEWELPFRDKGIDTEFKFNEMRVGSELWKRRKGMLVQVIDRLREQVDGYKTNYDQAIEPLDELEQHVAPDEDQSIADISEYYGSNLKDFIEEIKAGNSEVFHNHLDRYKDEMYDRAENEEKVDNLLGELEEALPRIEDTADKLYEAEQKFVDSLKWELKDMMEEKEPDPEELAVAHMMPLLVHGRIDGPDMYEDNLQYIESLEQKSEEVANYAEQIYDEFLNLPASEFPRPEYRFAQAIENTGFKY